VSSRQRILVIDDRNFSIVGTIQLTPVSYELLERQGLLVLQVPADALRPSPHRDALQPVNGFVNINLVAGYLHGPKTEITPAPAPIPYVSVDTDEDIRTIAVHPTWRPWYA